MSPPLLKLLTDELGLPATKNDFGELPLRGVFGGRRLVVLERTCMAGRSWFDTARDGLLDNDDAGVLDWIESRDDEEDGMAEAEPALALN